MHYRALNQISSFNFHSSRTPRKYHGNALVLCKCVISSLLLQIDITAQSLLSHFVSSSPTAPLHHEALSVHRRANTQKRFAAHFLHSDKRINRSISTYFVAKWTQQKQTQWSVIGAETNKTRSYIYSSRLLAQCRIPSFLNPDRIGLYAAADLEGRNLGHR